MIGTKTHAEGEELVLEFWIKRRCEMENLYPKYMENLKAKIIKILSAEYDLRELGDDDRNYAFRIMRPTVDSAVDSIVASAFPRSMKS